MMKIDKEKLLKEIEERLGLQELPGLEQLVEEFLNAAMESERKQYLDNNPDNFGNGSYPRELSSSLGKLNLKIPREKGRKVKNIIKNLTNFHFKSARLKLLHLPLKIANY